MRKKDVEEKVFMAFSNSVPDVLDDILLRCEDKEGLKKEMKREVEKRPSGIFISSRMLGGLAAVVVVIGASVFGVSTYNNNYKTDSIIGFDVNPSVELLVNKKEEVIEAKALNDEAKEIIKGMDLEDVDIDVAVNALIGSMLKNGYITVDSNSILVSVQNDDVAKGKKLEKEITAEIERLLSASQIEGAVLSQEIATTDDVDKLSADYEISVGKAKLINQVIDAGVKDSKGNVYTFDTLAGLSINELNVLLNSKQANVESVNSSGTASKNSYIGEEQAKAIAFKDANVKESNVRELDVEFDADDGRLVYEVEFEVSGKEYEYDIHATTGEIIYRHTEKDDDYVSSDSVNSIPSNNTSSDTNTTKKTTKKTTTKKKTSYIGESKAKSIAFKNAGVSESEVSQLKVELDKDDGVVSYEIEFNVGRTEYSYDINATTGKIIEKDIDRDDD